jgi:hypothetical protein
VTADVMTRVRQLFLVKDNFPEKDELTLAETCAEREIWMGHQKYAKIYNT